MENIDKTSTGEISTPTAHLKEVGSFLKESIHEFRKGNFKSGGVAGSGSFLNTLGFFASSAYDINKSEHRSAVISSDHNFMPSIDETIRHKK